MCVRVCVYTVNLKHLIIIISIRTFIDKQAIVTSGLQHANAGPRLEPRPKWPIDGSCTSVDAIDCVDGILHQLDSLPSKIVHDEASETAFASIDLMNSPLASVYATGSCP